jgi:hypothetical protein
MKFKKMKNRHYSEKLSAFVNHELPEDERQTVGEHLLRCPDCRAEHDEIKLGADILGQNLSPADAPTHLWNRIEAELDRTEIRPGFSYFDPKSAAAVAILLIAVFGISAVFYLNSGETVEVSGTVPENVRTANADVWEVETLAGSPQIENASEKANLAVGGILETDENSRAKIDVADIGEVEIAPNSLVKLVNSSETEHRLALERGTLKARIFAPPRLFVVDTPSASAVDLGCAYELDVDEAGNSRLHVTSGYVALEREGRESIVPAGALCYTKRGKGLGTPYFETAPEEFRSALDEFDFKNGGRAALAKILRLAGRKDTLTLWHLLSRVSPAERRKVLDKITSFTELPAGTTPEGIIKLDKNMLGQLKDELEIFWYD